MEAKGSLWKLKEAMDADGSLQSLSKLKEAIERLLKLIEGYTGLWKNRGSLWKFAGAIQS